MINRREIVTGSDGDLYIPRAFAFEKWEQREPMLDIAVMNGSVTLRVRTPIVQERSIISPYLFSKKPVIINEPKSLEHFIYSFDKRNK